MSAAIWAMTQMEAPPAPVFSIGVDSIGRIVVFANAVQVALLPAVASQSIAAEIDRISFAAAPPTMQVPAEGDWKLKAKGTP